MLSEIRKDPLSNDWVIIASERGGRPTDLKTETTKEEKGKFCPFCDSSEVSEPVKPHSICAATFAPDGKWMTRILPNKYPALMPEPILAQREMDDLYHCLTGVGGHEILVDSPKHDETLATMSKEQIEAIITNYQCRYSYWRKDPRITYLSVFKNHGKVAGASLHHPHSQLVATPLIPPRLTTELNESKEYFKLNNECLMCKILKTELENKHRLIFENNSVAAFCSFAPRFPFESLIVPKRHSASLEEITKEEISDLAEAMSVIFKKLDKLLNDPPFNYLIHVAPLRTPGLLYYHWHIEVILRLSQPAGFEWGSGVYINSVPPEDAALELNKVKIR
ncbi:MAG: galactose-1-phosphate uridylyltransferase [Actinobacteria bacterium]|nr:MAG: galactose-1-phosphate uridylyltransferase [Actinomycetota bacterium]